MLLSVYNIYVFGLKCTEWKFPTKECTNDIILSSGNTQRVTKMVLIKTRLNTTRGLTQIEVYHL